HLPANGGVGNKRTAVFILDRQVIYRQGLVQMLASYPDIEVVGDSAFLSDIYDQIESSPPDIVLVDIDLPSLSGLGMVRQVAIHCPGVATVVLSPNPDDDQLFQAIKSGASAFVNKDATIDELVTALRRVGQSEYPINDSLLQRPSAAKKVLNLFQNLALRDMGSLMTPLSQREIEILKYVAEGNPNKRIANALNISEQTIKNHITSIMRKLNANDRTHAVVLAIRNGWLNVGEVTNMDAVEKDMSTL
ncbi:MAG: response regulator transcription factor, partial [Dehalococcoidales bacterium]